VSLATCVRDEVASAKEARAKAAQVRSSLPEQQKRTS
jgi:hypothetical protein